MARDPLRGDWLAISRSRELYAQWSDAVGQLELSVHARIAEFARPADDVHAGRALVDLDDRRRLAADRALLLDEQLRLLAFGRGVTLTAALTTAFATPAGYVVADLDPNP